MTDPTDADLEALIAANLLVVDGGQCAFESWADIRPELVKFARDVLAEWGTPAQKTNQCGEVCERAKLCAICAGGLEDTTAPVGVEPIGYLYCGGSYGDELEDWEFVADQHQCDKLNEYYGALGKEAKLPIYTTSQPTQALAMGRVPQVDAAAKALAECMYYPWEHMSEAGRQAMREHAQAVLGAAHGIKSKETE